LRQALSLSASAFGLGFLVLRMHKPNRPLRRIGWRHHLAQGIKDLLQLHARIAAKAVVLDGEGVGFLLQLGEPFADVGVAGGEFAQALKGAHDFDIRRRGHP